MPKKRAAGAARPYVYWASQKWRDDDGAEHERRVQRWRIRLDLGTGPDGRRIRKTFTGRTSREAKDKYDKARGDIAEYGAISDSGATMRKYRDLFLESSQQRVSHGTWSHYNGQLHNYLTDVELAQRIADILPSDIFRIIDRARKAGRSVSFRHSLWTCLDQVFELALADRAIKVNPVKSVKVRGGNDVDTGRRAYSVPEMRDMLKATLPMPPSEAAIWWWRLFTGMRQSEILGAELKNLHLDGDDPHYLLTGSLGEVPRDHGCGQPVSGRYPCGQKKGGLCPKAVWRVPDGYDFRQLAGRICIVPPKSKRSRVIALAPELVTVMRRYLDATKDWPNPYGLIFRNRDGRPRLWKQDTREFKALLEAAGMDPSQRHGHETRYSAVTLMRKAGADTKAIEEQIGHTSLRVDDIYTTIDADQRRSAIEAIPAALGDATAMLPAGREKTDAELAEEREKKHEAWVSSRKGIGGRKPRK